MGARSFIRSAEMQRSFVLKDKLFCTMKKCMVSMATINVILEHGVYLQNHRKISENIRVYIKISCTIDVNKPRMLKEVSNEYYGNVLHV